MNVTRSFLSQDIGIGFVERNAYLGDTIPYALIENVIIYLTIMKCTGAFRKRREQLSTAICV